jgi:lysophospholipase L1-like esterase
MARSVKGLDQQVHFRTTPRLAKAALLACLALALVPLATIPSSGQVISAANSTPKVMVLGDSISGGFERPSYRQALLDIFDGAGCSVDMVGDQTLNGYDFRNPATAPGYNFAGFTRNDGYDIDHQAFPAIKASQFVNGVRAGNGRDEVLPARTYVNQAQPDYLLIHLGSNDLSELVATESFTRGDVAGITANIFTIVDQAFAAHDNPSQLRVLVANVITYAPDKLADGDEDRRPVARLLSAWLTEQIEDTIRARGDNRIVLVDVEDGFNTETMTFDGLHPNLRGETHMARAFTGALRSAGLCPNNPLPTTFPPLPTDDPILTSPRPGSTLTGSSLDFRWNRNGADATAWYIRVGSARSASDYYETRITDRNATSHRVTGLPTNGETLYIEFSNRLKNGRWNIRYYTVTAATV